MLVVEDLVIRIMERRDIENARLLHNDPSVLPLLSDVNFVSEIEQEVWFENMSRARNARRYVIETSIGEFVGVFRLDALDLKNRNAMIGLDIIKEKRGKSYAKVIMRAFFDYFFNSMGLQRLGLVTLETNRVAINLYNSLGFKEEGRQREAIYREGTFHDLICFSILCSEI